MRIAVLGAGAMGGLYGAHLAESGADVLLIDALEPLVNRLNESGLVLRSNGTQRRVRVRAALEPSAWGVADLLFVFVKAHATADALDRARTAIGERTTVISLQNGWGHGDRLARSIPTERILLGVSYHSATVVELGLVEHTAEGPTYIGAFMGSVNAGIQPAERVLTAAGFETHVTDRVADRIWNKLVMNAAANPTAALTGLRSGMLAELPEVGDLIDELATEVVLVANAAGYAMARDEMVKNVRESLRAAGEATASMRQDIEAGRRTEIDVITGAVIRAAEDHGIEVPLNRALYALIRGYELAQGFGSA